MERYFITIIAALTLLCSCDKNKVDQAFLDSTDLCLIDNGRTVHTCDPLTWQVAFNRERKEFRVFSDTMSDYYVLTCSELPVQTGQEIRADLKWTGSTMTSRNGIAFTVEKVDSQGRIWLWSRKSGISVSVMMLK